ncbi:MAG: 30S ribosomal protein S4 [archaeon]
MGDPKRLRKKYSTPSHPWQKMRIEEEIALMKEYGFKNKQEIWRISSKLSNFKNQIKSLISKQDELAKKQKEDLIAKLHNLKLIGENAMLEDILALSLKDLCERRLQTVVYKKNLARSVQQARQFIVHEHIIVGDNMITSPSYLVTAKDETLIRFADKSGLASETHPERIQVKAELEKELAEKGVKKEKPKKEEKPKKPKAPKKLVVEEEEIELPVEDELKILEDENE